MSEKSDQHSFLERWSRKKRGLESEVELEATQPLADIRQASLDSGVAPDGMPLVGDQQGEGRAPEGQTAAPEKDFSDFDFEKLDYESDYTQFMDKNVSSDARHKALRKLWVSNPVLANMDGLDDYCEDYTDAAVCLPKGMMKTAYRYGRGFLNDEEVAEWEALGHEPKDGEVDSEQDAKPADGEGEIEIAADTDESVLADTTIVAGGEDLADVDSGPGAACGVSVKQDELDMLAEYDAEQGEDGGKA